MATHGGQTRLSGMNSLVAANRSWEGTYPLWGPSRPPQQSISVASITPMIGKRFVRIDCTWSYDGEPQEGSLLCGYDRKRRDVVATWIDSWPWATRLRAARELSGRAVPSRLADRIVSSYLQATAYGTLPPQVSRGPACSMSSDLSCFLIVQFSLKGATHCIRRFPGLLAHLRKARRRSLNRQSGQ